MIFSLDQRLAQPSSEKLLGTNGNKYRDPQLDNVQKVRGLGTLSPKRDVSIKSLPPGLREPCRRDRMERL